MYFCYIDPPIACTRCIRGGTITFWINLKQGTKVAMSTTANGKL